MRRSDNKVSVDRHADGRTDRQTDGQADSYILPPNFVCGGYNDRELYFLNIRFV